MIKIGPKALEVLKAITSINPGVIIRNDYLHSKFQRTVEDNNKGQEGIIINYDLPKGEIETKEEIGVGNINEFLSVLGTFDKELVELENKGTTIVMKDKRKKVTYYTTTPDALPERVRAGEELFEQGETIIKVVLDEDEIERINKDLNILSVDKLTLKGEDGVAKFIANNSVTSNETVIEISKDLTNTAEGEFVFPNANIFSIVMKGIYKIEVRKTEYDGEELILCKMTSASVEGLSYFMASE